MILANLFVLKQIPFFGLTATPADPYVLGSLTAMNILVDAGHKTLVQKASLATLIFMAAFVIFSKLQIFYIPSDFDTSQQHYVALYDPMPRLLIASLVACFIAQQLDAKLFNILKKRFSSLSFTMLNAISVCISQAVDTTVFGYIGLWGIVNSLWSIMAVSYFLKLGLLVFSSPLLVLTRKLCKQPL
ncbi:MAG: queuosine precursor transporter [Parachlamydiales bacterium]|nr:queuosine precursor transporter [Parachlamydiales bacterium]